MPYVLKKPLPKSYSRALGKLYGNTQAPLATSGVSKPRKPRNTEERDAQIRLVNWLDDQGILFYAIPNGGKRSLHGGHMAVLEGLRSGVPDICIPIPRYGEKPCHGLYLELKRQSGGVVSEKQRWWLQKLMENGYLAVVCRGFDEAKRTIEQYLWGNI